MINQKLSLFELNKKIGEVFKSNFPESYWVIAEISEMKVNNSGHCYLELIEKGKDEKIIAKARATIWAFTFRMLKPYFETTTGQVLIPGLKILIQVAIEFHEVYNFSYNIKDIEPEYTIGDLERQRRETIKRLEQEGVIGMNKSLELPGVIQNIAVISSSTAAGYEDFLNQLQNNQYGYAFSLKLFNATMQGEEAPESIIYALDRIYNYEQLFDSVVIIRGGGAQSDLTCFDNYHLAYHITQFPLPVITGIGHEKDDSVCDIVAHTRLKTPTAVAEFIISHNKLFEDKLYELCQYFSDILTEQVGKEEKVLDSLKNRIRSSVQLYHSNQDKRILLLHEKNKNSAGRKTLLMRRDMELKLHDAKLFSRQMVDIQKRVITNFINDSYKLAMKLIISNNHKLEFAGNTINLVDPVNILNKGYTITMKNGKIIKDKLKLNIEDQIETRLRNGNIRSQVIKIE